MIDDVLDCFPLREDGPNEVRNHGLMISMASSLRDDRGRDGGAQRHAEIATGGEDTGSGIVLMPIGGQKPPRETPSIVRHFCSMP